MSFAGAGVSATMVVGLCVVPLVAAAMPILMKMIPQKLEDRRAHAAVSKQRIEQDSFKVIRELAKYFVPIKGNEAAKKKIIDAIVGWLGSKKSCTQHKTGGLVLYIVGPSGVGKSMAASAICKALLGPQANPFRISLSSIDTQSKLSVAEQLTAPKDTVAWGTSKVTVNTPLVNQLKNNPRTVVWIDEYDKLSARDHTLDDLIWDIRDSGAIVVGGKVIDCSNAVFVVTSNEDPEELWGVSSQEKDFTATNVKHSDAFKCRVTPIVFEFPDIASYKDVLVETFSEMLKTYEDAFNIHCKISKFDIILAAQDAKDEHGGIRKTQDYVIALASALEHYRCDNNLIKRSNKPIKIKATYCSSTKTFILD